MTTSKNNKKVLVTGDALNPALDKAFSAVVGGSLESEKKVWLDGCDLMARGIVSVRGMKATIEHTLETVGALPTLTTSSVQYWGKAKALHDLEGGASKSLKELLRLAREVASANNGKKGALTFEKAIEGKSVEAVRKATPTQGAQKRKASTASSTKSTVKTEKLDTETLAKTLVKALAKGGQISDATLDALTEALNDYMAQDIAA